MRLGPDLLTERDIFEGRGHVPGRDYAVWMYSVPADEYFLPRDALYRAKRGLAIACRLSVCPSVTSVDQDHIG